MATKLSDEHIQGIVDEYKEKSRSRGSPDRIKKQLEKRLDGSW